jgi:hypothetical protein
VRGLVVPLATVLTAGLAAACTASGPDGAASSTGTAAPTSASVPSAAQSPSAPASSSSRSSSSSSSSSSPSTTGTRGTAEFVRVVRARVAEVAAGRTTAEIAAIAVRACAGLRAGRPAEDIQAEARTLGRLDAEATDDATARELVKLAIDTVCLDQAGRVDDF